MATESRHSVPRRHHGRRRAAWRGIASIALLIGGCTTTATQTPATPTVGPSPTPTYAPTPSPSPLSTPEPSPAAIQDVRVDVHGDVRTVELLVPSAADTGDPLPLLVLLHGNGESPTRWVTRGSPARADLLAEREGILIALPPGRDARWDAMLGDQPESPDVVYVAGLVDWLIATYRVDRERVYVGGFSMGAVLAGRLGCERADLFAGFLMDAGGDWGGTCSPASPVTVVAMHGTNDTTLPIQPALDFTERWRSLDACPIAPVTTSLTSGRTAITSTDCKAGTGVMFVRVQGANHRYFNDPDALRTAWAFFAAHPRSP